MDDLRLFAKRDNSLDALVQTVRIITDDKGMQFGIDKCVTLGLQRGKVVKSEGIDLQVGKKIESLEEDQSYKYLGALELKKILTDKMETTVSTYHTCSITA